jgi:hypothetical protein
MITSANLLLEIKLGNFRALHLRAAEQLQLYPGLKSDWPVWVDALV